MSQEFTVSNWQPWENEEGLVRDAHGNYKGTVWFEEDSRQADATFKTEPNKGDKKYGDLVDYQTKAGKTRLKFQRADRPQEDDHGNSTSNSSGSKNNWTPRNDDRIAAQWAFGRAYEKHGKDEKAIADAQWLLSNLEKVEESLKADALMGDQGRTIPLVDEDGFVVANKDAYHKKEEPDPEFASMLSKGFEAEGMSQEELDSIPF